MAGTAHGGGLDSLTGARHVPTSSPAPAEPGAGSGERGTTHRRVSLADMAALHVIESAFVKSAAEVVAVRYYGGGRGRAGGETTAALC